MFRLELTHLVQRCRDRQMVFSISICLFVYRLPESPRWLVKVGRISEAASVFAALQNVTTDDPVVASQIADIQESLAKVDSSIGLKQVIRMGKEKNIWRYAAQLFHVEM
jgi:hypothetical protein